LKLHNVSEQSTTRRMPTSSAVYVYAISDLHAKCLMPISTCNTYLNLGLGLFGEILPNSPVPTPDNLCWHLVATDVYTGVVSISSRSIKFPLWLGGWANILYPVAYWLMLDARIRNNLSLMDWRTDI